MKHYLIALFIGLMVSPSIINYANAWRGYKGFGGEYLVIPLLLVGVYIFRTTCGAMEE